MTAVLCITAGSVSRSVPGATLCRCARTRLMLVMIRRVVREEVSGDLRREVDGQIHVTICSVLRATDRHEHGTVNAPPLTEFCFMGAKPREDVREAGHRDAPTAVAIRLQTRFLVRPVA